MKLRAALVLILMLTPAKSYADPMFALGRTNPFINASYAFGEIFTVGSSDLLVTSLGAFDPGDDGFFTQGGIPVGIFRESDDTLLESTLVQSDGVLIDKFRYYPIVPLLLLSGVDYRVVAVNRDDLYNIEPGLTVNPLITRTGYGYCRTRFLISCDDLTGTSTLYMANFTADPVGPEPVPEPASLILLGTGVAAIVTRARRARRRKPAPGTSGSSALPRIFVRLKPDTTDDYR